MTSDLAVPVPGGSALGEIHALEDGIFPEAPPDLQHSLLSAFFPFQILRLPELLRVLLEEIQLDGGILPAGLPLGDQVVGGDVDLYL